jgi:hypothetical protein
LLKKSTTLFIPVDKPLYSKEIDFRWKPFFLLNDEFMKLMLEVDNFFLNLNMG